MTTLMPCDGNGNPIPALGLVPSGAHALAVGTVSSRNTVPFASTTRVIGLFATVPVFIRTGGAEVQATTIDHYFPAGVLYDIALGNGQTGWHSHIAALRVDGDGILYVSERG
jgi:hypothetical protein